MKFAYLSLGAPAVFLSADALAFSHSTDNLTGDAESCTDSEDLAACLFSLGPDANFTYIRTGPFMASGSSRCTDDPRRLLFAELDPFTLKSPSSETTKYMPPFQFELTGLYSKAFNSSCMPLAYILSSAQDCQDDQNAAIELTVYTEPDQPANMIYAAPELSSDVSSSRQLLVDLNDCGTDESNGYLLYVLNHTGDDESDGADEPDGAENDADDYPTDTAKSILNTHALVFFAIFGTMLAM